VAAIKANEDEVAVFTDALHCGCPPKRCTWDPPMSRVSKLP
jgi:hypothetical protein